MIQVIDYIVIVHRIGGGNLLCCLGVLLISETNISVTFFWCRWHFCAANEIQYFQACVNSGAYAKHVSTIRVTICLFTAINLVLDVDCSSMSLSRTNSHLQLSLPLTAKSQWPPHRWLSARPGQQKALSTLHSTRLVHTLTCIDTGTRAAAPGVTQHPAQWQMAPETTGRSELSEGPGELSQDDPLPPHYSSLLPSLSSQSAQYSSH